MQLKRLEIKGFKSFGDKITINFDQGVTAVVGPNGCGKSNVVDSLRWVLGEQRARMLRSEKMENIIFNGTNKRKAQQMAEVVVSFSNTRNVLPTAYSEVTVSRRYFRTGESEYLLNGVPCRLKDINDLFLDTGIGPDSYAIIELKMVEELLADRENARRSLFEEAAGISKFKLRKKQTGKKLDDTEKDLDRVEDILYEIEKNLKDFERQARKAKKYYELETEYKQASIALAQTTLQDLLDRANRINRQTNDLKDQTTAHTTEIAKLEASSEADQKATLDAERLTRSRQKTLNQHVVKIRHYESEKKVKNERLNNLNDRLSRLKDQINRDRNTGESLSKETQHLENERNRARQLLAQHKQNLNSLQAQYENQKQKADAMQARINQGNANVRQHQNTVHQLTRNLEVARVQADTLKREIEQTTNEEGSHTANLAQSRQLVTNLQTRLAHKETEQQNLEKLKQQLTQELELLNQNTENLREQINQKNRELDSNRTEHRLTKSMLDKMEGFPEAIRYLKKHSDAGQSIVLLSDLVTADSKHRVAVENYLEPWLNYYVVQTENDAQRAIKILREASKGRAYFFILDWLQNDTIPQTPLIEGATRLLDLIEYNPEHHQLFNHLFTNVYLQNTDNHPPTQLPTNAVLISPGGNLISRRYYLSGGSVGLFDGKKIGRIKNLEKLDTQIKTLENQANKLQQQLNNNNNTLKEKRNALPHKALDDVKNQINLLHRELAGVQTRQEQFEQMLEKNTGRVEVLKQKEQQMQAQINELLPKLDQAGQQLNQAESSMQGLDAELLAENQLLNTHFEAFNQQNTTYHQAQNHLEGTERDLKYKNEMRHALQTRLNSNLKARTDIENQIKEVLQTTEVSDDELLTMYQERETIEEGVREAEQNYYALRGKIDGYAKQIRDVRRRKEQADALVAEHRQKHNQIMLELNSVKERLSVEFNITLNIADIEDLPTSNTPPLELKNKAESLKDKMQKMGPINHAAMEAFDEINERHTFITNQRNDLIAAKTNLLNTIKQIDDQARKQFLDTFEQVRTNFRQVFRSLFTDQDTCDLILAEPNQPLESKIDIIARPKGKRPLTINQLSGGEKTLTATALLFSIYLIKPAPFCIFDEVDAPLDDANIDKFNNLIRDFSKNSQFVLVTHNKRTMASTDVIYGVTMAEEGVSNVIPVDLRQIG